MDKPIWVTGGQGFLGRHVVRTLKGRGYEVVASSRGELDLSLGLSAMPVAWKAGMFGGVVHAAARVGGLGFVSKDPLQVLTDNLRIHLGAFEIFRALEIPRVVGVGSACAYPEMGTPSGEDDLWKGPLHASVVGYGLTKRVLEAMGALSGAGSIHLVLANLYGPGDTMEESRAHAATALIRRFTRAAAIGQSSVRVWGDGTAEREFLYVGDAARAIALALEYVSAHTVVNIGTGVATSIRDFVALATKATGFQGRVHWDVGESAGVSRKVMDVGLARRLLGFEATTSLLDGITAAVAWERSRFAL